MISSNMRTHCWPYEPFFLFLLIDGYTGPLSEMVECFLHIAPSSLLLPPRGFFLLVTPPYILVNIKWEKNYKCINASLRAIYV